MKTEAANAAQEAVSLTNDPTPPIHGSVHSALSSAAMPSDYCGLSFPWLTMSCTTRIVRPRPIPPMASSTVK